MEALCCAEVARNGRRWSGKLNQRRWYWRRRGGLEAIQQVSESSPSLSLESGGFALWRLASRRLRGGERPRCAVSAAPMIYSVSWPTTGHCGVCAAVLPFACPSPARSDLSFRLVHRTLTMHPYHRAGHSQFCCTVRCVSPGSSCPGLSRWFGRRCRPFARKLSLPITHSHYFIHSNNKLKPS